MICNRCKKDKEQTEFQFRKDRNTYRTTCKKCQVDYVRMKRNGGVLMPPRKTRVAKYNPRPRYAVKLHKVDRCSYPLCNCIIEEGQERCIYKAYTYQLNFCSEWCKEVVLIDKKLGLNTYEHKNTKRMA